MATRPPRRSRLDSRPGLRDCRRRSDSVDLVRHVVDRSLVARSLLRQGVVENRAAFRGGCSALSARKAGDDAEVFLS